MTDKQWTIALGVFLLLVSIGVYLFETIAHAQRDPLVLYGAYGGTGLAIIILGFGDEVVAFAKGVAGLTPWGKKGDDDA